MTEKSAVLAPMPSATVSTMAAEKPGRLAIIRAAKRRSCHSEARNPVMSVPTSGCWSTFAFGVAAIFYLMYICSHRFEGQGIDGKEIQIVFARACILLRRGYSPGVLLC